MKDTYKEQLSSHVEKIFKDYTAEGLHICDIATGGGKSYTIGKLTCEYYPNKFKRIVILCVQNKLIDGMNREIDRFINGKNSLIKPSDKIVIENNPEVITKAIKNGNFKKLLNEILHQIGELESNGYKITELKYRYNLVKNTYEGLASLINTIDKNGKNDFIQSQINEGESNLRKSVRLFFDAFKRLLEKTGPYKKLLLEDILQKFASLAKVYPQVEFSKKKVLLMTVHKAMYGIDPILTEKIRIQDFAERKNTLILFDESDQAATAMRAAIIEQSIDNSIGNRKFAKGYNGYLQYKALIDNPEPISNEYYGSALENALKKAQTITNKNWESVFGNTIPYKNIFLENEEELESYRRGVFFSGPAIRLNISQKGNNTNSYICYKKDEKHFSLVHSKDIKTLKEVYSIVIALDKFLSLINRNTTAIKTQFRKIISESLKTNIEKFAKEEKEISNGKSKNHYLGYPTLEREIHTFFSRFETTSEYQFEQQINEFITNRKNLFLGEDKQIKLPDYSVYSQGVQFYQEEIDEKDNQHRVRLSCREISTTPEKILIDLVNIAGTSVVLCSATASSRSVVSNFDIVYLKQILGNKIHSLTEEDRLKFDELVHKTYPPKHNIEIVPLAKYKYTDKRHNAITLPDQYKKMFSTEAIDEGLVDKWFKITKRKIISDTSKNIDDLTFQLYRLYQFIEAYHWFFTHDDVHSMIFFQNRRGDKDKVQFNVLSCLIDGSYKNMNSSFEDELPEDWENDNIRISKEWEDVENNILSELSQNKDAKLMLVSAYGSFKAGANMQYEIPEGLDYLPGDNWTNEAEKLKKDWDAIYVQSPTAYLMMNEDGNESTFEKNFYNTMLTLMMLLERNCLSNNDVAQWLSLALSNNFMFGEKSNPGIIKDKAAWAQTTIEQAIGRLCRTRNKPHTTYILFDESMKSFFDKANMEKSLTKEFKALANYILNNQTDEVNEIDPEDKIRCNKANSAQLQLNYVRNIALRYTPHTNDEPDFDDDFEDDKEIPFIVKSCQLMIQSYKKTIIKKPVIDNLDELTDDDKILTFIAKCYGNWGHDKNGCYSFSCDTNNDNRICVSGKGNSYTISPSKTRLDILMKNNVIKEHFVRNGYATSWKPNGLILHPQILRTDYAGEIGEEAFKAIMLEYTDCTEENLKHLDGKDYELADFVVTNPDGTYKIAFDVKNMNPKADHNDNPNDIPTSKKREIKRKWLGCELITVNMLQINKTEMGDNREIAGVIDENGKILNRAIEQLINLVKQDK